MGRDKALLELGGRRFTSLVRDAMLPLVERVRIIGSRPSGAREDVDDDTETQPDLKPGLGPLSGIHAALATAREDVVLVVACDLPFVTTSFLRGLLDRLGPHVEAVVPVDRSGPVPVCTPYRVTALAALERRLGRGELSARDFIAALETRAVTGVELEELDPDGLCLRNVNTPFDYEDARARASGRF
jgi:molybdenum cofactor guanylyltransferase